MGTNWQWFEKNHFNGCNEKRCKTVSIMARLKHFVLISWIQSSDYLHDFHQIFLLQIRDFRLAYFGCCTAYIIPYFLPWGSLYFSTYSYWPDFKLVAILICMMSKEFSAIKYIKQYYTEYSFCRIKHWLGYYCIFTRDDSELKYSRLNKGNKSFSRKWPENWNSIYPQTFENVHKIALRLSKKLHNC